MGASLKDEISLDSLSSFLCELKKNCLKSIGNQKILDWRDVGSLSGGEYVSREQGRSRMDGISTHCKW